MAEESFFRLFVGDAYAVVTDSDIGFAALSDFNDKRRGAGVERIFHQLLDDRDRPFDDFAGCDLIGGLFVENPNQMCIRDSL